MRTGSLRPGTILDLSGRILGEHGGHQRFTIGQRKGVGVAAGEPLYVVGKDSQANTVRSEEHTSELPVT